MTLNIVKAKTPAKAADVPILQVNPARVAWVFPTLDRGYYWLPTLREFARLFPHSVLFTGALPGPGADSAGDMQLHILRGAKTLVLKRHPNGYDRQLTFIPPFSIMWQLIRIRPRVIVTEQFGLLTLYALLAKKLIGARVILLCDGISPSIACLKQSFRLAIRRLMGRRMEACICNTRESAQYFRTILGIAQTKIVQEPYLVPDVATLCAGSSTIPNMHTKGHPVFLFVGSLSERKGVRQLLEAATELRNRNVQFSLIIVGEGELRAELESFIAVNNLANFVVLAGEVRYEDLGAYFNACDVFVLPTLEDIWAMVVLEAMAFGKMVLCSANAGAREVVQDGSCGWLFDPFDPHELAECMFRAIQDPAMVRAYGARSLETMKQYNPRKVAQLLAEVCNVVMNNDLDSLQSLGRAGYNVGAKAQSREATT